MAFIKASISFRVCSLFIVLATVDVGYSLNLRSFKMFVRVVLLVKVIPGHRREHTNADCGTRIAEFNHREHRDHKDLRQNSQN